MRVLHYIPSMARHLGGVAAYVSLLSGELGRRCQLTVATSVQDCDLAVSNCTLADLRGFTFTDAGLRPSWGGVRRFRRCCSDILDACRPDVVHVNGIWTLDRWLMQCEAQRRGIRTFVMPHGMLEPWIMERHYLTRKLPAMLLYQRRALRSAERLIATAESERQHIEALHVTDSDIAVVENGIDVGNIAMKTSWTPRRRLLYMSRLHPKKGIELLLDTAAAMAPVLSGYELVIAGEGEPAYVAALRQRASAAGLRVTFLGGVYGDEKWRTLREADFMVLPTHSENFGYVVAEALAVGTPVITTKGTPWQAIDGHCGYWTDRTAAALRQAMTAMAAKTAGELELMGRYGRRLVEDHYSARRMAEQLMHVYERRL